MRRLRNYGCGAATVLALGAALFSAPAAQASGLRVVSPRANHFFMHAPVEVTVHAPRSVRSLRARVDRRTVSSSFKLVRPGLWRARIGAAPLHAGADHLVVQATVKGHRDYDGVRFYVGRHRPSFLSVRGLEKDAAGFLAQISARREPDLLWATLDGKRLRRPLRPWSLRNVALQLGADDGLHFGVNHLDVFAARRDGTFDVERRTFVVPRDRPLAGAGSDRRTTAGRRVRLDGTSSRAASGPRANLSYHWRVLRRPRGSKGHLLHAASARPLLEADRPGLYRVQLTVTETSPGGAAQPLSRSSSDVATVMSSPDLPPIGETLETIDPNGENTEQTADAGIRLGSKVYWLGHPKGNNVQALILERGTLEVLYSASYGGSQKDAEKLEEEVKKYGARGLVVISNPEFEPESGVDAAFVPIVKSLGVTAAQEESIKLGRGGWSVVGVPGSGGGAYFGSGFNYDPNGPLDVRGNLRGYLEEGNVHSYGFNFVPAERPIFETSAPGAAALHNTIKVGGAEYASEALAGCGTGGFQVEVLRAETLAALPGGAGTFTTNGCGGSADEAGVKKMASFVGSFNLVGGLMLEGPKLFIVQSIGSPYDGATASAWGELATRLASVGATGSVFGEAREGYALVGGLGVEGLPLTEASQSLTGKAASLAGVLEQNHGNSYMPMLSSLGARGPYSLSSIAYQAPTAWPDSESEEQQAALQYASEYLNLEKPTSGAACFVPARPEVRSEYCNLEYENSWDSFAEKIEKAPFQAGHGFKEPVWAKLTKELPGEFENVQGVWGLISNLQSVFGVSSTSAQVNLKKIALAIEEETAPPAHGEVAGWWLELAANLLSTVSYYSFGVEGEIVQKSAGTLSGALFIAAQMIYGPQGAPAAETFKLETADFASELAETYLDASKGLGLIGEILVSDYGKLTAVKEDGLLGINEKTLAKLEEALGPGSQSWSYEKLLPTSYEPVTLKTGLNLDKVLPENATEYLCTWSESYGLYSEYKPFENTSKYAQLRTKSPGSYLGVLVQNGSTLPGNTSSPEYPRTPGSKLLEKIFKPESESGLGQYAPWFWRSAFGTPSAKERTVEDCG